MKKAYTNATLAQDYYSAAIQIAGDLEAYKTQRDRIRKSEIDLSAFYQENGSFEGLHVKGIGPKTTEVLELILQKGADRAKKIISENRRAEMRDRPWKISHDLDGREETLPSWDDAVKRYEGK